MRYRLLVILVICGLLAGWMPSHSAQAARGIPGSSEFGFGAQLNPGGAFALDGIHLASNLQLDWLAIDLSWQAAAPKTGAVDWSRLDVLMKTAERSQVAVCISLTEAPDWAMGQAGPDPEKTAQWVVSLAQRYPVALKALELFPGANTRQAWGRQPDANAYLKLWSSVNAALQKQKSPLLLVAAGLKPILANVPASEAVDDLVFLQNLYNGGIKTTLSVLSIRMDSLTGDPLQASSKEENRVFRHYEEVRQVMLKNKHESGLVWLTHLSSPADAPFADPANQSSWLTQAYGQAKSQLYIGVAFLNAINLTSSDSGIALIQPDGDYHPFYRALRDLVAINRSDTLTYRPGRPKDQTLIKSAK